MQFCYIFLTLSLTTLVILFQRLKTTSGKEVKYQFRYSVDEPSFQVFNDHFEHRHNDYVKGMYSLLEADGKVRTVYYEVDGAKGFRAIVKRNIPATEFLRSLRNFKRQGYSPFQHQKPISKITSDSFGEEFLTAKE